MDQTDAQQRAKRVERWKDSGLIAGYLLLTVLDVIDRGHEVKL